MPLSPGDREIIAAFRRQFESRHYSDPRFRGVTHEDRADHSTLATRFQVGERLWIELCVRPYLPQVRVGIVTDDRWISEELEEAIEETGDSMPEFIECAFEEVGLTWSEPPVEHYRDQGKYFYFATPLDLEALAALGDPATVTRVGQMFNGYFEAFRKKIEKKAPAGAGRK